MKFLQLNLNHCAAAHDLLAQSVREQNIDVAILSEPYRIRPGSSWATDSSGKAAIWLCGNRTPPLQHIYANRGFVRAYIGDIWVYSCYLAPSLTLQEFESTLDQLALDARGKGKTIVAGDFNSWSTEWGSDRTNSRGRTTLESLASLELVVINTGNKHTFCRAGYGSVIDVTFASRQIAAQTNWQLSSHYTASDHQAILFTIGSGPAENVTTDQNAKMFRVDTLNITTFEESFRIPEFTGDANKFAKTLVDAVLAACDASMAARRCHSKQKAPVYWWNASISEARRRCLQCRRQYQRARRMPEFSSLQAQYKLRRRELKLAIKESKRNCFLEMCNAAENDIWGLLIKWP
ncbi:uncharacterized protein [Drosophila tropicalis]|uniref:uncharacterized protein n=1 Tax=Drosophila tropicalis TaxID=46794 RepID=UPI0035ABE657